MRALHRVVPVGIDIRKEVNAAIERSTAHV
jgi:hypothetical protein